MIMKNTDDNIADGTQISISTPSSMIYNGGDGSGYAPGRTPLITGPQADGAIVDLFNFGKKILSFFHLSLISFKFNFIEYNPIFYKWKIYY